MSEQEAILETSPRKEVALATSFMLVSKDGCDIQIGKVTDIGQSTVTIHIHVGNIDSIWSPLMVEELPVIKTVKKSSIVDGMIFHLTKSNRLPFKVVKYLKAEVSSA